MNFAQQCTQNTICNVLILENDIEMSIKGQSIQQIINNKLYALHQKQLHFIPKHKLLWPSENT